MKDTLRLREELAAIEHQRWADWQKYMHSLGVRTPENFIAFTLARIKGWERQINTPYAELSEKEKDSDREQVDRYLPLILSKLEQERKELVERIEMNRNNTTCEKGCPFCDRGLQRKCNAFQEEKGFNQGLDVSLALIKDHGKNN